MKDRRVFVAVLSALGTLCAEESPQELLERVVARANTELDRLPDFTCKQTVERMARFGSERPWERIDTLHLEVGMSRNREMYSWADSREFQDQQLSDLIGKGMIGTGHFALLARHVFLKGAAQFTYKGRSEVDGRAAHEWDYDVPAERSRYRLRTSGGEAITAFQGTIWADAETMTLLRLDVTAYDIPEKLELAEASNTIRYARVPIGDSLALLPAYSMLTLVATDGNESHNRLKLGECRQFKGEATLTFAGDETKEEKATAPAEKARLSSRTVLEVELAEPVEPAKSAVGEAVRVTIARPVKDGERVIVPQGAAATARIVRLEKQTTPYPLWEIALELASVKMGEEEVGLAATMVEAGPESGLVRVSKTFMPTFTKRRNTRMDILVRETPKGQGVLHWDAKRQHIPKGLRMKWSVE